MKPDHASDLVQSQGLLRVASNGRTLEFEDGRPFFYLVPFQGDFDKLSSCARLEANLLLQEESNAQQDLHR